MPPAFSWCRQPKAAASNAGRALCRHGHLWWGHQRASDGPQPTAAAGSCPWGPAFGRSASTVGGALFTTREHVAAAPRPGQGWAVPQYGGRLFCAHVGHRGPSPFRHGGRWCLVLTTEHDQHASGGTAAWGRSTPWQAVGPCTRGASWPPAVPCKPGLFQLHGRRCAVRTSSMASMRSARRGRAVVLV